MNLRDGGEKMKEIISITRLTTIEEAEILDLKFAEHFGWYQRGDYYRQCLEENQTNKRVTLIAHNNDSVAGCCHLLYESKYPFFVRITSRKLTI